LGVIDSLSAGYRFLGRRPWLAVIPILLDFVLWFSSRLSVNTLLLQVADFYRQNSAIEGMSAEMTEMSEQVAQIISNFGEGSNLLTQLVNQSLLHVPSLMVLMGPMPDQAVNEITSWGRAFVLFVGIGVIGLLIGVFYLSLLAHYLPIGNEPKAATAPEFLGRVIRNWGLILAFVVLALLALLVIYIPFSIGMGLVSLISPLISSFMAMLLGGLTMLFFFYLYFAPVALILDNLSLSTAVMQSVHLIRSYFWSTLGFVLLTNVISIGFALILTKLGAFIPMGTAAAIVLNAFIGTGLAMALLVFYRTRWIQLAGEPAKVEG